MTAVQAPGPEPLDFLAVAQRRPPRGPARWGGRFPIQLADAGAGGLERSTAERGQRAGSGIAGTDGEAKEPALHAGTTGPAAPPAPPEMLPPTPPPGIGAGGGTTADGPGPGQAARTPGMAVQPPPAPTSEARARSNETGEAADHPAPDGGPDAAAPAHAAPEPATAPVRHAGLTSPEPEGVPASAALKAHPSGPAPAAAPQPARRDASTSSAPSPTSFRLEPAGWTTGPAPSARADRAVAQAPEPAMPADVLVGRGAEGLEVTIAAATPDLRDRFRAATGDLEAELSAIGAEVDAIHVELRAELADGGSGAGADARDWSRDGPGGDLSGGDVSGGDVSGGEGPAGGQHGMDRIAEGQFGPAETARGEADAAARLELFDPAMGQAPDPETPADDKHDANPGFEGSADARSGNGADTDRRARDIERLRLLPGMAEAGPGGSRGRHDAVHPAPGGQHRIDRYA